MDRSPIVIRDATVDDIPIILRFIGKKAEFDRYPQGVEATPEKLRQTLFADRPRAGVLFAEVEGTPVGFASYFSTYSTFLARPGLWLDDLFVDEEHRSRGVGEALVGRLAQMAVERDCGRIEWTAAAHNDRGLAFYRRLGATVRETARLCRLDREGFERLVEGHA
jgi:GNAT superfamily N-acetyltransferase